MTENAVPYETPEPDMFPEDAPEWRIEITDPDHVLRLGETHGLMRAKEALEAVPAAQRTAGFTYALALIDAQAANARAGLLSWNIRALLAKGIDLNAIASCYAIGHTLVVTRVKTEEPV